MELKLQAVQLHENEGLIYSQIAQQLGMRSIAQVEIRVRRYRQEGVEGLKRKGRSRTHKTNSDQERIDQLEMRNALLKNIIPSCARLCSRGAISDRRTLPERIPHSLRLKGLFRRLGQPGGGFLIPSCLEPIDPKQGRVYSLKSW